jgi:hypothetical protein
VPAYHTRGVTVRFRAIHAVIIVAAVVLGAWVVVSRVKHWGDWVVLGVIIMTAFGASWAIYTPRYPWRKRTFVRTTKPPR